MGERKLSDQAVRQLTVAARGAMRNACCEYSHFPVAAALLASDGSIHISVNVESSSYGGTVCAERVALARALADGAREFLAIVVATDAPAPVMPCGICRQLLHDYAPDVLVIAEAGGRVERRRLAELLPDAFGREAMG